VISERESFQSAQLLVRIAQVSSERGFRPSSVDVNSKNQAYWYASDSNGYIPILQDAAFVCTGVHVIGAGITSKFTISIENMWPSRQATQNAGIPVSFPSDNIQQDIRIPINHFLPAFSRGNIWQEIPPNVDYYYTPVSEWLIARGDTVRFIFDLLPAEYGSTSVCSAVLSGYKVLG
jgi:hypothetical protein